MAGIMTSKVLTAPKTAQDMYRYVTGAETKDQEGLDYWDKQIAEKGAGTVFGDFQRTAENVVKDYQGNPGAKDYTPEQLDNIVNYMDNNQEPVNNQAVQADGGSSDVAVPTAGVASSQGYTAAPMVLDPATDTVEGRLKGIMSSESPLMAQARADALKTASSRGLINSTLAATAGEDAMLRAAVPIASQDANTYAASKQFNAGQTNAASAFTAGAANTASIQNAGNITQANIAGLQSQTQLKLQKIQGNQQMAVLDKQLASQKVIADNDNEIRQQIAQLQADTTLSAQDRQSATQQWVAQLNASTQESISRLEFAGKKDLLALEAANKNMLQSSSAASAYFNQAVTAITNIQLNDKMGADAKTAVVNSILAQTQAALKDQEAITGINISANFDKLVADTLAAQGGGGSVQDQSAGQYTDGTGRVWASKEAYDASQQGSGAL